MSDEFTLDKRRLNRAPLEVAPLVTPRSDATSRREDRLQTQRRWWAS